MAYLPGETPEPLRNYKEKELVNLRGDGNGRLEEWDRVYGYSLYNDLGNSENGKQYARTILGGSAEYPYPRRGRTGRKPTKAVRNSEHSFSQRGLMIAEAEGHHNLGIQLARESIPTVHLPIADRPTYPIANRPAE